MAIYDSAHWQALLKRVGAPDLFQTDAHFATHASLKNINAYGVASQHMRKRTRVECMKDLPAHDIPIMPMKKLDNLLTAPQPFEGTLRRLRLVRAHEQHTTRGCGDLLRVWVNKPKKY